MPVLLSAAAGMAGGLFSYNRENFFFDKHQDMKLEYQAQEMKVRQFELYREDVRDLVSLTIGKMENYLIVNCLQVGFCFTLFAEGRPKPGCPFSLVGLFTMCNAGALLYYLLSMWLAMHASVSAHGFGVRLLTQFVRLPVPAEEQLDQARALAQDYEGMRMRDILRVPLWKQQLKRFEAAIAGHQEDSKTNGGDDERPDLNMSAHLGKNVTSMKHVQMFRTLQAHWQAYDAYARVCMAMGTNQLLHTLSYTCIGLLVQQKDVPFAAFTCVITFTGCAWVLARLDLYISREILAMAAAFLVTPPLLTLVGCLCFKAQSSTLLSFYKVLTTAAYMIHVVWILFTVTIARASSVNGIALPTRFRSILFLDIYGWLDRSASEPQEEPLVRSRHSQRFDAVPEESSTVPSSLRPFVIEECQGKRARIAKDLERWESSAVAKMLKPPEQHHVSQLRALFDAKASELDAQMGVQDAVFGNVAGAERVWLQLEWGSSAKPIEYYYQCETGQTHWTRPSGSERICDVTSLELDIAELGEKVRTLGRKPPGEAPTTDGEPAAAEGGVHGAELDSFHPQQAPSTHRKPGRLPWLVVIRGSRVLILMWLLATVLIFLTLFGFIKHWSDGSPTEVELWTSALPAPEPLVLAEAWPHKFFRPVGLGCDSALGTLLVAERYAVHELRLDPGTGPPRSGVAQPSQDVGSCLSRVRGFQGKGLASIGVKCGEPAADARNATCWASLLGAGGRSVLQCALGSPAGAASAHLDLRGGPWRAFTPGDPRGSWALGDGGIPTQLGPRAGSQTELQPALDLPEEAAADNVALHVLGDHTLLGLSRDGKLRAWPLGGGRSRSWDLPALGGSAWTALCAAAETLYLAAAADRRDGVAGIWKAALPEELRVASAAAARRQ